MTAYRVGRRLKLFCGSQATLILYVSKTVLSITFYKTIQAFLNAQGPFKALRVVSSYYPDLFHFDDSVFLDCNCHPGLNIFEEFVPELVDDRHAHIGPDVAENGTGSRKGVDVL